MVPSCGLGRSGTLFILIFIVALILVLLANTCISKLFLRFEGPTTILMQSRTARLAEVFRRDDFNELADTEPGALEDQTKKKIIIGAADERQIATDSNSSRSPKALKVAIVKDGKLEFQDSDFKAFTRS